MPMANAVLNLLAITLPQAITPPYKLQQRITTQKS